jgi:hypothetical protein
MFQDKNMESTEKRPSLWACKAAVARKSGIPIRTLENWAYSGAIARNEFGEVDLIEVLFLHREKLDEEIRKLEEGQSPEVQLIQARTRKCLADCELLEYQLEEERAKLISVDEARDDFRKALRMVTEAFHSLPDELEAAIAIESNPKAIQAMLTSAIDTRLQKLSEDFQSAGE